MSEGLASRFVPEDCAEFFVLSFGVTALIFLLGLLLGTAVALKRFWRTRGDGKPAGTWMKPYVCLLRRFSPVGILIFSAVMDEARYAADGMTFMDLGYGVSGTPFMGDMWYLVFFLLPVCFLPEISDMLLAGMREASDSRDDRMFFQRTLAKALPRLADAWGEIWKISLLYIYLLFEYSYNDVYFNMQLLPFCLIACVIYWLISLLVDRLFGSLSRRLAAKQTGAESKQ